jgi:hypothetical protein
MLVELADHGPPTTWPHFLGIVAQIYIAPGGLVWLLFYWKAFGAGPNSAGDLLFVATINASLWTLACYLVAGLINRLHTKAIDRPTKTM